MATDMDIKLDPIHKQWIILAPVDWGLDIMTIKNQDGDAIFFSRKKGTLSLTYKNDSNDMGQPGKLSLLWKPIKADAIRATYQCKNFVEADAKVAEFLRSRQVNIF